MWWMWPGSTTMDVMLVQPPSCDQAGDRSEKTGRKKQKLKKRSGGDRQRSMRRRVKCDPSKGSLVRSSQRSAAHSGSAGRKQSGNGGSSLKAGCGDKRTARLHRGCSARFKAAHAAKLSPPQRGCNCTLGGAAARHMLGANNLCQAVRSVDPDLRRHDQRVRSHLSPHAST